MCLSLTLYWSLGPVEQRGTNYKGEWKKNFIIDRGMVVVEVKEEVTVRVTWT